MTNKARQRVTSLFVSPGVGDQKHPPQFHFGVLAFSVTVENFNLLAMARPIERIRSVERELIDLD